MNSTVSQRAMQRASLLMIFAFVVCVTLVATSRTNANAASLTKLGSFSGQQLSLHADGGFLYSLDNSGPDVTIRRIDAQTGAVQTIFTAIKGSAIAGGAIHENGGSDLSVRNGLIVFVSHSSWIEEVVPEAKDLVSSVVMVRASDGVARVVATARSRYDKVSTEDTTPCGLAIESATVTTRQRIKVRFTNVGGPTLTLRNCPPTLVEESGSFVRSYGEDGSGGGIVHQSLSQFWAMPDGRRYIGLRSRKLTFVNKANNKVKRVPVTRNVVTDVIDTSNRLGFMLRTIRVEKDRNIQTTTMYPRFGSLENGVRLRGFAVFCGPLIAQRLRRAKSIGLLNKRGRSIKRLSFDAGSNFGVIHCSSSQVFATRTTDADTEVFAAKLP